MPYTVNRFLNVPDTGSLPGSWGTTAVNANMSALDGLLGGFATISLSSATTFALGLPAGAATGLTPGAGPSQSQNSMIKFTGTLTGNAVVQFTMPGFYIVHNNCGSAASFYVQLAPASGTGNSVGAPPGQKMHVFFDGTDVDYVDMPPVGSALDLHQSGTSLPVWMTACTVSPYLIKNGTVHTAATYPALAAALGSTFGGNGATTFGVPDELSRVRLPVDSSGSAGRITSAGSGVNGTTMGAAGGSQFLQSHAHTASVSDSGHAHPVKFTTVFNDAGGGGGGHVQSISSGGSSSAADAATNATTSISVTVNGTGSGSSGNVMPVIVSFLPLIKT